MRSSREESTNGKGATPPCPPSNEGSDVPLRYTVRCSQEGGGEIGEGAVCECEVDPLDGCCDGGVVAQVDLPRRSDAQRPVHWMMSGRTLRWRGTVLLRLAVRDR
jgi:hypothetical protein